ncbi:MAG: retroviral-like aspartic protease family protein [Pseudomonadota bacterium]|nr:retroviral-like aspartic protease family protein [Pseudomonadota bacterium]
MNAGPRVWPGNKPSLAVWGATVMICILGPGAPWAAGTAPTVAPPSPETGAAEDLAEIMVEAPEPRFVAPTRRDQIGRIWAPVFINGHGPFRLVLDTGASHSGVTAMVALALGIPTDKSPPVILRGVTGYATVPTIRVDTLSVGDVAVDSPILPIVPDAMGGAEGVLGSEGLANKRIFIDFRHDEITIAYSRGEKTGRDFTRIPFHSIHGQLIVVEAMVGDVRTKAIIDTGGQTTVANLALRDALARHNAGGRGRPDQIVGATMEVEAGEIIATPAIGLGPIKLVDPGVTFADLYIFRQWKLTREPAIMIGMDALGVLDTLIIDYRQHELQMRLHKNG